MANYLCRLVNMSNSGIKLVAFKRQETVCCLLVLMLLASSLLLLFVISVSTGGENAPKNNDGGSVKGERKGGLFELIELIFFNKKSPVFFLIFPLAMYMKYLNLKFIKISHCHNLRSNHRCWVHRLTSLPLSMARLHAS